MGLKATMLAVKGRVQRVGYRRYVLDLAQEAGVAEYVKNERDGSVTIFAQGGERILASFLEKVKSPLPPALVQTVEESKARPRPRLRHFDVIPGRTADELQEGFGAMQSEFRDYREEFRDYNKEFRDYRQEFRDYRGEFRDFASRTDENFGTLERKYGEISEKLTSIVDSLTEESKKSKAMLEAMREEGRQGKETLAESLRLLRDAVDRLARPQ